MALTRDEWTLHVWARHDVRRVDDRRDAGAALLLVLTCVAVSTSFAFCSVRVLSGSFALLSMRLGFFVNFIVHSSLAARALFISLSARVAL